MAAFLDGGKVEPGGGCGIGGSFRVRYVHLERTWVAGGDRQRFFGAALNARDPWLIRGLEAAAEPYVREYDRELKQFMWWMTSGKGRS